MANHLFTIEQPDFDRLNLLSKELGISSVEIVRIAVHLYLGVEQINLSSSDFNNCSISTCATDGCAIPFNCMKSSKGGA